MNPTPLKNKLPPISTFTFGCMSLGRQPENFTSDVNLAKSAMEREVWFHASQEYAGGGTFMILNHAFRENRARIPKMILKIRCDHAKILRYDVEDALLRLNIERVDIAQLCRGTHDRRPIVDDFLRKGEMWQVCQQLQKEGKVGHFVMEIFGGFSSDAIRAVEADLFPGYIFYLSPGERQTNNELYDLLERKKENILALRTVFGGLLDSVRIQGLRETNPTHLAIERFDALSPIYERSGCASWTEFCFSFIRSFPTVLTTISGTSKESRFNELLDADRTAKPLDEKLIQEIQALHGKWAEGSNPEIW